MEWTEVKEALRCARKDSWNRAIREAAKKLENFGPDGVQASALVLQLIKRTPRTRKGNK